MNKGYFFSYHSWFITRIINLHINNDCGPICIKNISLNLKVNNTADWAILQRNDEYERDIKIKKLISNYVHSQNNKENFIYRNQEFYNYIYREIFEKSFRIRPNFLRKLLSSRAALKDISEILVMYENMKRCNDLCHLSKKKINNINLRNKSQNKLTYKDYPIAFKFNGNYGLLDGAHRRSILRYLGFRKSKHIVFNINSYKFQEFRNIYNEKDYKKLKENHKFYLKTMESIIGP